MDEAEFIAHIKETYEHAESVWRSEYYKDDVTAIVFYTVAYRRTMSEPYAVPQVQQAIVGFLENKLDEVMTDFPLERAGELFDLLGVVSG